MWKSSRRSNNGANGYYFYSLTRSVDWSWPTLDGLGSGRCRTLYAQM